MVAWVVVVLAVVLAVGSALTVVLGLDLEQAAVGLEWAVVVVVVVVVEDLVEEEDLDLDAPDLAMTRVDLAVDSVADLAMRTPVLAQVLVVALELVVPEVVAEEEVVEEAWGWCTSLFEFLIILSHLCYLSLNTCLF